ncbi:MAG: HigA family addiction module antidote protein [Muribaculaceae bacterium]|nr:HigA family addiction module antidote protein [Muribaculaceae bacterium]
MATNAKSIVPAVATHPGSVLKKELKARGIKQKDFAKAIGMPAPNLSELIKGKRNVTEAIAIKLEEALGIPFQNWMNLQNRYHYVKKCHEELDSIENNAQSEELSLRSRLNIPALYKFYNISSSKASERLDALKKRLRIDLNGLDLLKENTNGYFKRSERLKIDEINMLTWLLIAWSEAIKAQLPESYSSQKGIRAANEIAVLANSGMLTPTLLKNVLNKYGIIYIHVPKLELAPIDAYSMMAGPNPAIVVTYRHNDLDKLVFDVLHEIGHIIYHITAGKSYISVENDYFSQSKEEREADKFANDTLIPHGKWCQIISAKPNSLSPHVIVHTIAKMARDNGVSASIAVARYKHETRCYNIRGYRSPKIDDLK